MRQVSSAWVLGASVLVGISIMRAPSTVAGILTGKVTNPNNVGVVNVKVDFYESASGNQVSVSGNLTDANGNYGVLVNDGLYDIEFITPVVSGGIVPVRSPGTNVVGTVILNVQCPFGKVLSGSVTDSLGALILTKDIDLNVADALTGVLDFTPNDNSQSDGMYRVIITPGLRTLTFAPQTQGTTHAAVSYPNVNITTDLTLNVSIPPGVIVSGTVVDQFGDPVVNADLDFDSSTTKVRITTPSDNTDGNGDYIVTVPRGTYDITVEPQVADRLVAQRIFSVPINANTTINFTMQSGWSLSGTVSGPGGSVVNCDIDVVDTLTLAKLVTPGDKTDAAGFYEVIVPTGNFELHFQPPVATHLASVIKTGVHVDQDTVVNASVPAGFLLQGTVQSAAGGLIDACDIDLFDAATQTTVLAAGDKTNFNGFYQMVVTPKTYDLEYEPPKARRLQAKRVLGIVVSSDLTRNVILDSGLSVSGTITGAGSPVANVNIDAIIESSALNTFQPGDLSDATGFYRVIVGFVPHSLLFYPPVVSGYAAKKFAGINPGADFALNVALSSGFLVQGSATQAGGAPISGVVLRAWASGASVPLTDGVSNGSGHYETRLGPATYRLAYYRTAGSQVDSVVLGSVSISKDTVVNVEFAPLACSCPCRFDPNCDGIIVDVLDVVAEVGRAFRGDPAVVDSGCPNERTDLNTSGATDVLDVIGCVNVSFRGQSIAANFVDPCPQ